MMADEQADNILHKMARVPKKHGDGRTMTPARSLRLGLERTSAQLWDLAVKVSGARKQELGLEDLEENLPEDALMILLDGPDGMRGGAALDRALVAALIEVQTIGAVQKSDPSDRTPTPTDAAMIAPWIDGALERSDVALCQDGDEVRVEPGSDWAIGYRFGALAEDARSLSLVMDSPDFHIMKLQIQIDGGARSGTLALVLPTISEPSQNTDSNAKGEDQDSKPFLSVAAEISVVASRLTLTLAEAGQLKPGDVLTIDNPELTAAEMRAIDGTLIGTAKLGQLNRHWAIRLHGTPKIAEDITKDSQTLTEPSAKDSRVIEGMVSTPSPEQTSSDRGPLIEDPFPENLPALVEEAGQQVAQQDPVDQFALPDNMLEGLPLPVTQETENVNFE
jgi:flagellar motor switch protein FliM